MMPATAVLIYISAVYNLGKSGTSATLFNLAKIDQVSSSLAYLISSFDSRWAIFLKKLFSLRLHKTELSWNFLVLYILVAFFFSPGTLACHLLPRICYMGSFAREADYSRVAA